MGFILITLNPDIVFRENISIFKERVDLFIWCIVEKEIIFHPQFQTPYSDIYPCI